MNAGLLARLAAAPAADPTGIRVADQHMSEEALLRCATAVADRVHGLDRVAVIAHPTMETVVGVVGALLAGVTVVPVAPDAGPVERGHVWRDSGAAAQLLPAGEEPVAGPPAVPVALSARADTRYPIPDPAQAALILYTSGTTGLPKGAVISHRAAIACLAGLAEAWAWCPDDVLVHGLPLYHVHGLVLGVLGALQVGSRLHHVGRPRPARYAAAGGTIYFGVPTVWSRIGAEPAAARALRGARLLISGSAGLPAAEFARLRALTGHAILERYGMTETLITVSARAAAPRLQGTVGTPIAGVETRLATDRGDPVPADGASMGELQVRGATLFSGYLNRPDADAASTTADGWFRTGDIATIDPGGWHRIVGRAATDLIKSGGFRIGAGEVEEVLLSHPAVVEAAVIGTPHPDLGEQVTAFVVCAGAREAELHEFVARTLTAHKRPRRIHLVERLPRNALGKVQKSRLPRDG